MVRHTVSAMWSSAALMRLAVRWMVYFGIHCGRTGRYAGGANHEDSFLACFQQYR